MKEASCLVLTQLIRVRSSFDEWLLQPQKCMQRGGEQWLQWNAVAVNKARQSGKATVQLCLTNSHLHSSDRTWEKIMAGSVLSPSFRCHAPHHSSPHEDVISTKEEVCHIQNVVKQGLVMEQVTFINRIFGQHQPTPSAPMVLVKEYSSLHPHQTKSKWCKYRNWGSDIDSSDPLNVDASKRKVRRYYYLSLCSECSIKKQLKQSHHKYEKGRSRHTPCAANWKTCEFCFLAFL